MSGCGFHLLSEVFQACINGSFGIMCLSMNCESLSCNDSSFGGKRPLSLISNAKHNTNKGDIIID